MANNIPEVEASDDIAQEAGFAVQQVAVRSASQGVVR